MIKYSLIATIVAFFLTLVAVFVFKSFGGPSSVASASITALFMIQVWGRSKRRLPTSSERKNFLVSYWILMLLLFLVPSLLIGNNAWGIANMFVLASAYPLFMLIFFRDKYLVKYAEE